jgi:hypothetical protein
MREPGTEVPGRTNFEYAPRCKHSGNRCRPCETHSLTNPARHCCAGLSHYIPSGLSYEQVTVHLPGPTTQPAIPASQGR